MRLPTPRARGRSFITVLAVLSASVAWDWWRQVPLTPVVITFETLAVKTGEAVTTQYQNLGVTFNGPVVIDYSSPTAPGARFPHSPTKAIEQCYGAEFCTAPFALTFRFPQRRVKVWAGHAGRSSQGTVVLQVFDTQGRPIGAVRGVIPVSDNPHIGTPVEISLPNATIARAVVSSPDLPPNGFAIDDIEFEPGLALPTPPRVAVPDLTGLTPAAARASLDSVGLQLRSVQVVDNDQFRDGTIFSQSPHFHTLAARGSAVDVVVARAPIPRELVPDLGRLGVAAARTRLAEAHMQLGSIRGVSGAALASAIVVGQSLPPGSMQPWGTVVDIDMVQVASPPPLETVPDLSKLTLDSVRVRLARAGLRLGRVRGFSANDLPSAVVVSQSVPPGSLRPRGTIVDVDMMRLPPPRPPLPPQQPRRVPLEILLPVTVAALVSIRAWRRWRWRIRTRVKYGMSSVRAQPGPNDAPDPDFQVEGWLDPGTQHAREGT